MPLPFFNVALSPALGGGERWLNYRARTPSRMPPLKAKEFILERLHICTPMYTHIHTYTTHAYTHTHTHAHTHTHTHTYTQGPGPADYSPFSPSSSAPDNQSKPLPYYRQKHYLCISAPAMPLPPPLPPPRPGHYEVQTPPDPKKKLASGAVFLSTTNRWLGTSSKELYTRPR